MAVSPGPQPIRPSSPARNRLNSWKEIAAHLNTTARTVQRWEKTEQLPVHRHLHSERHSVYAFRSELDEWWTSRGSSLAQPPPPASRRRTWVAAAVVLVALAAGLGFWRLGLRPAKPNTTAAASPAAASLSAPVELPPPPVPVSRAPENPPARPPEQPEKAPPSLENPGFLKAVPLTSYPGQEQYPSFSPDASQVAFTWGGEKQDNVDIYVKVVGSGSPLRVTTRPGPDYGPAWSPDGRAIAFLHRLGDKVEVLLVSPLGGGGERKLAEMYLPSHGFWSQHGHFLAWSPDSRWLAASTADSSKGIFRLVLLSAETGEMRELTQPDARLEGDVAPSFSPDGRTLAFSRVINPLFSEIYLLDLSSDLRPRGDPRPLTSEGQMTTAPVWTSDGRAVIFISGSPGMMRLWKIPAAGGRPQPVEVGYIPVNTVARAGKRLAFSHGLGDSDIWRVDLPAAGGAAGAEASLPVRLISSSRPENTPQFSPDGARIAFQSGRSGNPEIYVCNRDGSHIVPLTSFGGHAVLGPRWSPDGKQVAFVVGSKGSLHIYTIDAGGGRPKLIDSDPFAVGFLNWSRDGNWIYFPSRRTGQTQTWKVPVAGGEPVQISRNGGWAARESPDGKFVHFLKDGAPMPIWRVPVGGGEESLVTDRVGGQIDFLDRGLYFLNRRPPGITLLNFFSFETGAAATIAEIGAQVNAFTVSPDQRTLVYSQQEFRGADLMLVDNFR